jgi:MFS family permease
VQGLGAGTITVVVNAAVGRSLPPRLRPKAFAALAIAWVLPSVVGPAVAGFVSQAWTWRAVFLGVVPAVLIGLVIAIPAIREADRRRLERFPATPYRAGEVRTVVVTASLLTVGAAAAIEAVNNRIVPLVVALTLIGGPCLVVGVRRTLPPSFSQLGRYQRAAAWVGGLSAAAFFGTESLLPLTITSIHDRRPVEAGAVLTVAAVTWTAGSYAQSRLIDRLAAARLASVGLVLVALGILTAFAVDWAATPWWLGFAAWGLAPAGMGILTPLTSIVVVGGEDGVFGEPLATLQLLITLGTALGTGAAGAAIAWSDRLGSSILPGLRFFDLLAAVLAAVALRAAAHLPRSIRVVAGRPVTCEHD